MARTKRQSASTCQLDVGFISSTNGGSSWSAATQLTGPLTLNWLANTTQGRMVGDYISSSFAGGLAHGVFVVANAPSGGTFDEAMYTNAAGLSQAALRLPLAPTTPGTVVSDSSDHPDSAVPLTAR